MRRSLVIVTLLSAALLQHLCSAQDAESLTVKGDPVVNCRFGALRGNLMKSRSGKDFYGFLGIKYAKAPVGELRFKPPVPNTETWDDIRDAKVDGPSCPQAVNVLKGPSSEDCLYLNVFTPKLDNKNGSISRLPVIFWIHHGGYVAQSSLSTLLGPQYFMDERAVMVMTNYRLGALGFLSTGDEVVPGNMGLKDQVLALKWVRDNIECFGGDPNLVTLIGYSAGGSSGNLHMASKSSTGLFHRVISMSGTALCNWAVLNNPREVLYKQAKILNCPHGVEATSEEIVDCLRTKDAEEIAKSYQSLKGADEPFLQEDPACIFSSGNFNQVPWITGTTSNEMMNFVTAIVQNSTLNAEFSEDFNEIAPVAFYYERGTHSSYMKSRKLKKFYFPDDRITNQFLVPIEELYTDGTFMYCADRAIKLISEKSKFPSYYYNYKYLGNYSLMTTQPGLCKHPGPVHHDDLPYIFYMKDVSPLLNDNSYATILSKKLVRTFYRFAVTGNPTPPNHGKHGVIDFEWKEHTPEDRAYLEISDGGFKMKRDFRQGRAAIWNHIYCDNEEDPTCDHSPTVYRCK